MHVLRIGESFVFHRSGDRERQASGISGAHCVTLVKYPEAPSMEQYDGGHDVSGMCVKRVPGGIFGQFLL